MASFSDRFLAGLGWWHAGRVYRRFAATLAHPASVQQRTLARIIRLVGPSEFGRRLGLERVADVAGLRAAAPIHTFEDLRPYVERVMAGEIGALFTPDTRVHMFASSSGTTAAPKYVPVTDGFVRSYRRGWNTFGLKLLRDHPDAILRHILQVTGRHDTAHAGSGAPIGAITGLLARTQKGIVRRFYVGHPDLARIEPPESRYYALMRLAAARDVAFAITANPATLIRLAQTMDTHSETLIRDIHDGSLSRELVDDDALRRTLLRGVSPERRRARDLERLRTAHGRLAPRDCWRLSFVACWIGGSLGHYLPRLQDWWGALPVRDIGLLASEGRVTIPLTNGVPAGPLDLEAAVFEFIPAESADQPAPETLLPDQLERGRNYVVVLSNDAGLVRYRLDDVVRCVDILDATPVLEFLHRYGRVSSLAGEKLTENQVSAAVSAACQRIGFPHFDFLVCPVWGEPPGYRLSTSADLPADAIAAAVDEELCQQNEEYESRRKSHRLKGLEVSALAPDVLPAVDRLLLGRRRGAAEQFKRPILLTRPGEDAELFSQACDNP